MQADPLSRLLDELPTGSQLRAMEERLIARMDGLEIRLRSEIVRATADSQTQMMRWALAMVATLATIMTLLELFVG